MDKKAKQLNPKVRAWFEPRERHHISHAQIQMAQELRMNQAKLGKLDNLTQEQWKLPLPRFIEERARLEQGKQEARRAARLEAGETQ